MECQYPNRNGRQGYKHGCRCLRCKIGNQSKDTKYRNGNGAAKCRLHDRMNCKLKCADKRARKYGVMCSGFPRKLMYVIYRNCPPGWSVDHIIPMSKGGSHHPMNIQYMTLKENLQKGARGFWLETPGTAMQWWDVLKVDQ